MERVEIDGVQYWKDEDGDYYKMNIYKSLVPVENPTKKRKHKNLHQGVNPHAESYLNKLEGVKNEEEIYQVEVKQVPFRGSADEEYEVMDFSDRLSPGGASGLLNKRGEKRSEWKNIDASVRG